MPQACQWPRILSIVRAALLLYLAIAVGKVFAFAPSSQRHLSTTSRSFIVKNGLSPPYPSNEARWGTVLHADSSNDEYFDPKITLSLIGGQSVLALIAAALSLVAGTPNLGLGPGISFDSESLKTGALLTLPMGGLAVALDLIEDRYPALQDVTKATQRSVMGLLGGQFKPILALLVAGALGLAAGLGEEMLFRGIVQYELTSRIGASAAVLLSSLVFGALHAVTPMYAALASLASVYFGGLYLASDNLAVPISCHAVYDVAALFYAHWTVCQLSDKERLELSLWAGPRSSQLEGQEEDV